MSYRLPTTRLLNGIQQKVLWSIFLYNNGLNDDVKRVVMNPQRVTILTCLTGVALKGTMKQYYVIQRGQSHISPVHYSIMGTPYFISIITKDSQRVELPAPAQEVQPADPTPRRNEGTDSNGQSGLQREWWVAACPPFRTHCRPSHNPVRRPPSGRSYRPKTALYTTLFVKYHQCQIYLNTLGARSCSHVTCDVHVAALLSFSRRLRCARLIPSRPRRRRSGRLGIRRASCFSPRVLHVKVPLSNTLNP